MLGTALRGVADVGHIVDVHAEQREMPDDRLPAKLGAGLGRIAFLDALVVLDVDGTADLDLSIRCGAVDDAVQQNPRIAAEIQGFGRPGHHRQPQVIVHDERLYAADPGGSVAPGCAYEQHAWLDHFLVCGGAQSGLTGRYFRPSHISCLSSATDRTARSATIAYRAEQGISPEDQLGSAQRV